MSAGIRSGVNCTRLGVEAEHRAQGLDQLGLAEAGDADQQRVPAGQQGDERVLHHFLLAEDDAADPIRGPAAGVRRAPRPPPPGPRGRRRGVEFPFMLSFVVLATCNHPRLRSLYWRRCASGDAPGDVASPIVARQWIGKPMASGRRRQSGEWGGRRAERYEARGRPASRRGRPGCGPSQAPASRARGPSTRPVDYGDPHRPQRHLATIAGSPIGRKELVCLFASVLQARSRTAPTGSRPRPSAAGSRSRMPPSSRSRCGGGLRLRRRPPRQCLTFRTNLDQLVTADAGAPDPRRISARRPASRGPTSTVRPGLEARINRAVFYELVALRPDRDARRARVLGVWSQGRLLPDRRDRRPGRRRRMTTVRGPEAER